MPKLDNNNEQNDSGVHYIEDNFQDEIEVDNEGEDNDQEEDIDGEDEDEYVED